jgi:hypothetical protein
MDNNKLKDEMKIKGKLNPVNVGCVERMASGVREVPCCVNAEALLRVTGLAERYILEHPEAAKDFKDDIEACEAAGEIYNYVWKAVNRPEE